MDLDNSIVEYIYLDGQKTGIRVFNENNDPNTILIPLHEANTDYQAIQQWILEGNTVIDNGE
jgi:hypothetical protein